MELTSSNLSKAIVITHDINVSEIVKVEKGSILHFCSGRFVNKSTTGQTFIIEGDDVTIIANPEQIFVGDFDFRRAGKWVDNPDYDPEGDTRQQIWQVSDSPASGRWHRPCAAVDNDYVRLAKIVIKPTDR